MFDLRAHFWSLCLYNVICFLMICPHRNLTGFVGRNLAKVKKKLDNQSCCEKVISSDQLTVLSGKPKMHTKLNRRT